jgi:type IV secretory pathway component VirB8
VIPSKSYLGGAKPFAFTEQGVAMLSSVLKSKKAIQVNLAIMRAFVIMRRMLDENKELREKIESLESKYDKQFSLVFEAIKQLIQQENKPRNPIGFRVKREAEE